MKHMKKFMALFAALALVMAMAVPAFAATTSYTLVDHDFEAYQIFTGTFDNDKLSNVQWGDGVASDALLNELKTTTFTSGAIFASCTDAKGVAGVLANHNSDETAQKFAEVVAKHLTDTKTSGKNTVTLPAAGYYLIKDVTNVEGIDDAKNLTLLKVSAAGSVTPAVKTDKPTVEKKVQDKNDTTGATTGWQDSADYDIGDTIPYQLTATMGDLSNFKTYEIEFVDTMTHLTYQNITSVKIDGTDVANDKYTVTWDSTNKKLSVKFTDVKELGAVKGSKVVVEYTATLDADAVIGSTGNPNEVSLVYDNNPNGSGKGETPKDKNIVFTYKVSANKVDQDNHALAGAAFALYKKQPAGTTAGADDYTDTTDNSVYKLISKINVGADGNVADAAKTTFEWNGVDDGDYLIIEVITPSGYNTIEPFKFTVTAAHDETSDNPKLTELVGGNGVTGDATNGTLTTTIINHAGTTLPSTGGIGTTIFYVVGGGLMVAAAVLLVAKKRMENK